VAGAQRTLARVARRIVLPYDVPATPGGTGHRPGETAHVFLPTGDTPNPRNFTAYVNWGLIALNVAVFILFALPLEGRRADPNDPELRRYIDAIAERLPPDVSLRQLQVSAYDLFVFEHGYKPGAPGLFDLLFAMFLHGGLMHLAGNMLFLWIYGDNVEHRLGRVTYLVSYLATGVAATLFFSLFTGDSMVPMIGASGAISGVLGLYFVMFPRNRVKVLVFLYPFFIHTLLIPARVVLTIYLVVENLLPSLLGSQTGVAYFAHIGGFLAGLVLAYGGERYGWRWPWKDSFRRAARATAPPPPSADKVLYRTPVEALRAELARNSAAGALNALGHVDGSGLAELAPAECVQLSGYLEESGYPGSAARLLRTCLARHRSHGDLADVYLNLGLLRLHQGQPTAAYQHLLSALESDPSPRVEQLAREALAEIDVFRRRPRRDPT
jgi:membrane associated rhomboid family serine protease